jgi:hypothetical protein
MARTEELAIRLPPRWRIMMRPNVRRKKKVPRRLRSATRSYSASV